MAEYQSGLLNSLQQLGCLHTLSSYLSSIPLTQGVSRGSEAQHRLPPGGLLRSSAKELQWHFTGVLHR
jgi:hypothetical protein